MSHHHGPSNNVYNPHSTKTLHGYDHQLEDISGEHRRGTPNIKHAVTVQFPTCILHTKVLTVPVAPHHMGHEQLRW